MYNVEGEMQKTGMVRLLRLTEKQYRNNYMVTGELDYQEKTAGLIVTLWYNQRANKYCCENQDIVLALFADTRCNTWMIQNGASFNPKLVD